MTEKTLHDLAVGDEVIITTYTTPRITRVSRITATQIVVENGSKYRKSDGFKVGGLRGCIYIPKEHHYKEIEKNKNIVSLRGKFNNIKEEMRNLSSFTQETLDLLNPHLDAIEEILKNRKA